MRTGFIIAGSGMNFKPMINQPLGVLYLQTILDEHFRGRIDSSVIDLRGISPKNAIYHVPEKDLYFHSVTSPEAKDYEQIVAEIRRAYPRAKHVAGGINIRIFPEEAVEVYDAIAIGEGEELIKQITRDAMKGELRQVYRQTGVLDINAYPIADRSYLPKSAIAMREKLDAKHADLLGTDVLFSRGCNFNCYFCANQPSNTRFRTPTLIETEINYLKREYGIQALAVKDDQGIPVNRILAKPALEAIARTGIIWRGQSRGNGVHPDMVKLARESGCVDLAVGIESVDDNVLKIINKKIDLIKAKEYLGLLRREGIDTKLLLILGLPGEPDDIADRTIDFIKEANPSSVLLSLFCPMPGSDMFNHPERFGIKTRGGEQSYRTTFGRFDASEKPQLAFDYEKTTPFGRGMSADEIAGNYMKVQAFLRDNKLNF